MPSESRTVASAPAPAGARARPGRHRLPRPVEGSAPKHVERVELGAVSDEEPRYCHVVRHAARVVVRKMPVAVDSGGAHVHRVFPVVVGHRRCGAATSQTRHIVMSGTWFRKVDSPHTTVRTRPHNITIMHLPWRYNLPKPRNFQYISSFRLIVSY